jgi:hypothetical protein
VAWRVAETFSADPNRTNRGPTRQLARRRPFRVASASPGTVHVRWR